jgi:hypothetical protein
VSTQLICSREAEVVPCICGSATLAMVVSIWFMIAAIIEKIMISRRVGGGG